MRINTISSGLYRYNKIHSASTKKEADKSVCFNGKTGFILGAVTGGVMASLFSDMLLLYAGIGAILGDWLEDRFNNNNNNDDDNENNMRNENNLRLYR